MTWTTGSLTCVLDLILMRACTHNVRSNSRNLSAVLSGKHKHSLSSTENHWQKYSYLPIVLSSVPVCDKRVCGKGDNSLIFTVVLNVPWVLPLAADSPVQKHLHNHCQVGVCVCFACSFCCVLREFYVAFAHPVLQKNRHFRIHITHTHTTQCLKWMDWVLLIMNIGARA